MAAMLPGRGLVPAQAVPRLAEARGTTDLPAPADLAPEGWGEPDLFWIDPDLTELAIDAAEALDEFCFDTLQPPAPFGFMAFARPVPMSMSVDSPGGEVMVDDVPIRAMSWQAGEVGTQVLVYGDRGNSVRFVGMAGCQASGVTHFRGRLQPAAVYVTVSLLLAQPGITDQTRAQPQSRPAKRTAKGRTPRRRRVPPVRVVTVRPGSANAAAYSSADGKGREFRHRWVVRGHWRQQPYPSLGDGVKMPVWIAPHLKGPAGAPLLDSPKVTALRGPR